MRDTQQLCLDIIQGLQQSAEPVPGVDGKFHGIYIIVNQVNMKFYVGKHTRKFESLDKYFGSGTALNAAIEKYGVENFTMNYFQYCESAQEVHDKETELLKMLLDEVFQGWKLLSEYCYNRKMNEGFNAISDETREKQSAAQTGKILSDETRAKQSASQTGELNPMFGKGYLKSGELNPMFGRTGELHPMFGRGHLISGERHPMFGKVGSLGGNFRGITIGINKQQEVVVFDGGQDMDSRPTRSGKFFNNGKIYQVINGRRASHAGFKFHRTLSTDILQQYLETATFYDTASKLVLQNYLSSVAETS